MIKVKFKEKMEAYCVKCDWIGSEDDVPDENDRCPCCDGAVFLR